MSNSNDYAYTKEFEGNLLADSKPVPVKVTTRLRINTDTADEIRKLYSHEYDKMPEYAPGKGNLPLHPSLLAMGRHYFKW